MLSLCLTVTSFRYTKLLNLTGSQKVLKKYEKVTKVSVLDVYMKEKACNHACR